MTDMAYQLAVCDDNATDIQYLLNLLEQWARQNGTLLHTDTFPSAEAFLFRYEEQRDYDILLLDIEMGRMDGVTLARTIRRENESVQIVFITGYSDYIAEGYDVSALHYLMKPLQKEKFFQVMDRAMERLRRNEKALTLELSGETLRIPLWEIRYLEVCKNYVTIHGRQDYTVKKALGDFQPLLDERFFRLGRSYILNLTRVERITRTEVTMQDGAHIPLPRSMYEPLNRAIISL